MKKTAAIIVLLLTGLYMQAQQVRIAVLSDIHYFNPALLIKDGKAFEEYLAGDRKMLRESEAILQAAFDTISMQNINILLLSGDLTKDGELSAHLKLASMLSNLESKGIKVYVCPGNHDINNPGAKSYNDSLTTAVSSVTPENFSNIYNNFGYAEALYRDNVSLSYIAEPVNGLWILSIDACKYKNNFSLGYAETGGYLSWTTRQWIKSKLYEAKKNNKIVIAIMHHNLIEHFNGQNLAFPDFVIENSDSIAAEFAKNGLKILFSGHFHAMDAIEKKFGNDVIVDAQTGSLVTWPCPYRIAELKKDHILYLSGNKIHQVAYPTGSKTFQQYAYDLLRNGSPAIIKKQLISPPYSLSDSIADWLTPAIVETLLAHYNGNETDPSPSTKDIIDELKITPYAFMSLILESIWNDALPDDWNFNIEVQVIDALAEEKDNQCNFRIYHQEKMIMVENNESEPNEFQLFTLGGKLIGSGSLSPGMHLNFNNLNTGIYLLRTQDKSNSCFYRILVQ